MNSNQINNTRLLTGQLTRQLSDQSDESSYLNDPSFFNHQYQNVNGLQSDNYQVPSSSNYQVPSSNNYQVPSSVCQNNISNLAQVKRNQFGQYASRSFPIQNVHQTNEPRYINDINNLTKGFQPNLALHKINSHPLASSKSELNSSFTLNRTTTSNGQSKSSYRQTPRFCRTQSTTSAISLQSFKSIKSGVLINNNLVNNTALQNTSTVDNKRISNLSSYTNTPPLPVNSTLSKQSKRNTQASLNYSMQSFKSNYLANLPESYLNSLELNGVESVTSSSYLHGFILISIILLSIIAFVLSKFQDACEEFYLHLNANTCYTTSQFFFSFMLLFTSLFAFIVYFLHLIGQCDYLNLMAKRKVFTEILVTCLVIFCLLLSSLIVILTTVALFHWISTSSLIIAFIVCILYKIRIYLLFREYRMLNDKPQIDCTEMTNIFNSNLDDNRFSSQLDHKINNQQINLQFNQRFSIQSNQQIKEQVKDDEIDDDVFG